MASCTPGTDCYCDCARHTTGLYKNAACESKGIIGDATALLMCEDFEAPTLRLNQGVGDGAPFYGPPYDDTGQTNNRGVNGYWNRTYGGGGDNVLWASGEPPSPTHGPTCGFGLCSGLLIWTTDDRWNANPYAPPAAFLVNGEYTAEPSLVAPTDTESGVAGTFDGAASLFSRVPAGQTVGIYGQKNWSKRSTFGITQAYAYAPNVATTGPGIDFWKGDQWQQNEQDGGGDGLLMGHYAGWPSYMPFYQFTFNEISNSTDCNNKLNAATKVLGDFSCDGNANFLWQAASAQYTQTTHWPLGKWGCVRAYYQNIGTSNSTIEIWFTGPGASEVKLVEITGMDLTNHYAGKGGSPGYVGYVWNNYANANQEGGGGPTTETSGRYQDNVHIRAGSPVSCAQIGYGGYGTGTTISPSQGTLLFTRYAPDPLITASGLAQEGYRWRNDNGNETDATWAANQDTPLILRLNEDRRLRVIIDATVNEGSKRYRLEYKLSTDSEWRAVESGTGPVRLSNSGNLAAGGEDTTFQLTPPSGKTTGDFVTGRAWGNENGLDYITVGAGKYTELEWAIVLASPAAQNQKFQFRVTRSA